MHLGRDRVHACEKAAWGDHGRARGIVTIAVVGVVVEGGIARQSPAGDLDTIYVDCNCVVISVVDGEVVED